MMGGRPLHIPEKKHMSQMKKNFLIWTSIAGSLFIIVGVHDLFFFSTSGKTGFVIALEMIGGFLFILNALIQFRKRPS